MSTASDQRLVEILTRCLRELSALQEAGRLQDPASRAEIEFLEHELRVAEARAARGATASTREVAGVPDEPPVRRRHPEGERLPTQEP